MPIRLINWPAKKSWKVTVFERAKGGGQFHGAGSGMHSGNFFGDARGFGGRVWGARDLASDDQIVGAVADGIVRSGHPFLIALISAGGTDSWGYQNAGGADDAAHGGSFERGSHEAIDTRFHGLARAAARPDRKLGR